MNIGLGIGIPFTRSSLWSNIFTPTALFMDGSTEGVWYDPSDIKLNWRRNLLTYSEQFDNAAWSKDVSSVSGSSVTFAAKVNSFVYQGKTLLPNTQYIFIVYVAITSGTVSTNKFVISHYGAGVVASQDSYHSPVTGVESVYFLPVTTNSTGGIVNVSFRCDELTPVTATVRTQLELGSTSTEYQRITDGIQDYLTYQPLPVLYQDAAGTTPVTAVEQPVGLMLDKSGRGNHAYQTVSTKRPVLSARVNLLTKTEDFSDAAWVKLNATVTANAAIAPDGKLTACKLIADSSNNTHFCYEAVSYVPGSYKLSIYVKASEYTKYRVVANSSTTGALASFDLSAGTYSGLTLQGSGWTNIAASISNVGNGWWLCSITFDSSVSVSGQYYAQLLDNSGNATFTGNGTSGIYIWGADLRVTNTGVNLPPYQRVNTATDYDTVGFPTYLKFDGIDDSMQTNSIDFSATDKMTAFAGVRKLSDAARGMFFEFGAAVFTNVFRIEAPHAGAESSYAFGSAGSGTQGFALATAFPSPTTNVLTGIGNISGDQAILRVNGTQAAISTTDQGTGNYGNYPLYIGARAGTSLFFNGNLYQLIIAGGSVINIAEEDLDLVLNEAGDSITAETTVPIGISTIEACERFVNRKTLAY